MGAARAREGVDGCSKMKAHMMFCALRSETFWGLAVLTKVGLFVGARGAQSGIVCIALPLIAFNKAKAACVKYFLVLL